jgi:hypothetical protein
MRSIKEVKFPRSGQPPGGTEAGKRLKEPIAVGIRQPTSPPGFVPNTRSPTDVHLGLGYETVARRNPSVWPSVHVAAEQLCTVSITSSGKVELAPPRS